MRDRRREDHPLRRGWAVGLAILLLMGLMVPAAAATSPELIVRVGNQAGQPVAGAAVEVYGLDQGLVHLASAGADGTVRLPYAAGQRRLWLLRVSAKGYRAAETGWFDPAYGGVKTLWLEPVGGDLQILFRNAAGERVSAHVSLLSAAGRLVAQAAADGGRFSRQDVPAGEYRAVASAAGYAAVERPISVAAGRMTVETISLAPAGFTVTGAVVDAITLSPLVHARVEILRGETVVAEGATALNGRFEMISPVEGEGYRVRVSAPGYAPAVTAPRSGKAGSYLDFSGLEQVRLSPLTGSIEGVLLNESGLPIADTQVVLLREGFGEVAAARTGDGGDFRLEGLAAGAGSRYQVVADEALDHMRAGWHHLVASDWVEAKPGVTVQVSVVAKSWFQVSLAPGVVSGRVNTPAGLPVEGATVELIRHTRVERSTTTDTAGSFTFASVEASEKDGFALAPYMLRISKEGFVATRQVTVAGEQRTHFALPVRARLVAEATLWPAATDLTGRVVDRQGRPVVDAQVTLDLNDRPAASAATTNGGGWYRLSGLPAGAASAALRVTAPGYLPAGGIDVTASLAEAAPLPTVQLTPRKAALDGVIVDFSGKPVGGAEVKLWSDGALLAEAVTETDGYYQVEADLTTATLALLTVARKGYTSGGAVLADLPGPGERLKRSLLIQQASAILEGRVLDEAGRPVAAAEVELVVEGRGAVQRTLSGPDGRYQFEQPLPDGAGWVWLRVRPLTGSFAGSLSHGLAYAPLTRLTAGDRLVIDLLVRP